MRILGICKVRNEEKIIKETLDHWGKICTGGIYIVDDKSDDKTMEICMSHPAVKSVQQVSFWDPDREKSEWALRQMALERAQQDAEQDDWFVYFDADERLYFDNWELFFAKDIGAIACRLYDIYITPEDELESDHNKREWVGPEYRTIVFFFRNSPYLKYDKPDQRVVDLPPNCKIVVAGMVKHFGKGLSVQHFEETCDYYINFWPKYADKWIKRKGTAIHTKSDFGNELIKFNDVLSNREEGFSLEQMPYGKN